MEVIITENIYTPATLVKIYVATKFPGNANTVFSYIKMATADQQHILLHFTDKEI